FHTIHFKAGQRTAFHGLLKSFLYGRYIFLRNVSTLDYVLELKPHYTFIGRFHSKYDIRKFTTATGLFLINLPMVRLGGKGLLVFHLRLALVNVHFKLTSKSVYDNIQMELAHP